MCIFEKKRNFVIHYEKMKILYAITLSELGGAQSVVLNLANEQAKENDVLIVSGGAGESWENLDKRVKVKLLPFLRRSIGWRDILVLLYLFWIRIVYRPDVVHLHSSKIGTLGRIAFNSKKTVYTVHGFSSMCVAYRKLLFLERMLQRSCAAIVGVSHFDVEAMAKEGITHNVSCIYNGVADYTKNGHSLEKSDLRVRIKQIRKSYKHIVLCVARDAAPKRRDLFEEIARYNPNCAFVWIGNKQRYQHAPINVYYLGNVPNAFLYWRYVDVCLLPSDYEGMPISIIESLVAGVPAIASNVGGVSELLNGDNGFAVDNTEVDFSAKLHWVLEKAHYAQMAQAARESYENVLTVERMNEAYSEIYHRLADKK